MEIYCQNLNNKTMEKVDSRDTNLVKGASMICAFKLHEKVVHVFGLFL